MELMSLVQILDKVVNVSLRANDFKYFSYASSYS